MSADLERDLVEAYEAQLQYQFDNENEKVEEEKNQVLTICNLLRQDGYQEQQIQNILNQIKEKFPPKGIAPKQEEISNNLNATPLGNPLLFFLLFWSSIPLVVIGAAISSTRHYSIIVAILIISGLVSLLLSYIYYHVIIFRAWRFVINAVCNF